MAEYEYEKTGIAIENWNHMVTFSEKFMPKNTQLSRTSNNSDVLRIASGRHLGKSGFGGTTIAISR
jgi:hypothetical protein